MNRQITGIIPTYSSKDQENVFTFGKNYLKVYPRSNITFNILPHLELDEEQKCIIDNLWISFSQIFNNQTNKSLDRKYFITCLKCLTNILTKRIMAMPILVFMLSTEVIKHVFLKHRKKSFLIFQIILDNFSKDFII